MSSREEAFENLMDVPYPVLEDEYPQHITLPEYVYEKSLEALSGTVQDSRERSMHFRFRQNQWCGGIAIRGKNTRTNRIHTNSAVFLPPHLHSHTHPDVSEEELAQTLEVTEGASIDSENEIKHTIEKILQDSHRIPSSGDVYKSLINPSGSVGHLLISSYGNFAWVHKDLSANKGFLENPFSSRARRKAHTALEQKQYVKQKDDEAYNNVSSIQSLWETLLETRAQSLASAYVCYVGDPRSPELRRVDSKT